MLFLTIIFVTYQIVTPGYKKAFETHSVFQIVMFFE